MQTVSKIFPKVFSPDVIIRKNSISSKDIYRDLRVLLNNLRNKSLLSNELNKKLILRLNQCNPSMYGNDRSLIKPYYDDLLQLNQKHNSLKREDEEKIQRLSRNLLQTMEHQNYSIVELLIKLKMIFSDLLEDLRTIDEIDEECFSEPESEQEQFLHELINAPLDDIRIFLEKRGKAFGNYYRSEILDDLAYCISNNISNSKDFLDKLCDFLRNELAEKYSPLTAIDLITYSLELLFFIVNRICFYIEKK
ncbi:unnamed protein product [Adineta ricciae]|uniref:Uncharacterized protein n=1 Tax=Adineta ricciae TaxID=249248 RepID=A0A816GME9_ADIRI|nr:unnamed protein product [Adineta ricciae]CAF1676395.1 unnamed protein product [Adineta ricciae]